MKVWLAGGCVLALGALAYWGSTKFLQGPPSCQVCYRPVHPGQEYTIILADGTEEHTCCPRCGMHFQARQGARAVAERATDFLSGARIDPARATFVEGSDLMTCCSSPPLKRDEPQRASELVWDRCLPSLVAFETRAEALQFSRQHGGRILTYGAALASARLH